jgi:hypothetical protein
MQSSGSGKSRIVLAPHLEAERNGNHDNYVDVCEGMRQTGWISLRAPKKQSRVTSRHAANPIHDAVARRAATTWRTDPAGENGSGAGSNPGRWDWSADWQFLNVSRESNFAPDSFF